VPPVQCVKYKEQAENFSTDHFHYNQELDQYICPEGNLLTSNCNWNKDNRKSYKITDPNLCRNCPHFGQCTKSNSGRIINRHKHQYIRNKITAFLQNILRQALYRKRGQIAELPFGHIKRNLGVTSFLLRRFSVVKVEMAILSTCFNLRRLMTILGTKNLIYQLNTI